MAKSLEAHDKLLSEVFSDNYQFQIPDYQRPYSWTKEQAGELFNDILDAMRDNKSNPNTDGLYFLGSIVLIKADRESNSDVVDGQQRLTTLTILFSALRETLTKFSEEPKEYLYRKGVPSRNIPNQYRLRVIDEDATFFRESIQEEGGIRNLIETTEKLKDSRLRYKENAALFIEELEKLNEDERIDLWTFLGDSCSMVVISTPNLDAAYRIFSILNNRGLDLSPTDILKAEILGDIRKHHGDDISKQYAGKWNSIERDLGRDNYVELFGHIRSIYAKKKQHAVLTKEFNQYVASSVSSSNDVIDSIILPYAKSYGYLKYQNYTATEGAEQINEQLRYLNAVDWWDWMPPAMLYMKRFQYKPYMIIDFLKRLERLTYYLMVTKKSANIRIDHYASVIKEIEEESFNGNSSTLISLSLNSKEMKDFIDSLNGDIYQRLPKARTALILRLESLKSDGSKKQEFSNVSIEHILPQTPSEQSNWLKLFPDTELRETWTQRLANLVPLDIRKNQSASNASFDIKKETYFIGKNGKASPFVLTQEVRSMTEWTPDVLEKRQETLLQTFIDHWQLKPDPETEVAAE